MEPVSDWWRKRGLKCLRVVNNGLFSSTFWLQGVATNAYLARGFWKRLMLTSGLSPFLGPTGGRTSSLSMTGSADKDLEQEVSRTHDREDPISAAVDKVTRITYGCNIRMVYIPRRENIDLAEVKLNEIAGVSNNSICPISTASVSVGSMRQRPDFKTLSATGGDRPRHVQCGGVGHLVPHAFGGGRNAECVLGDLP